MGLPREIRDCIYGHLWSAPFNLRVVRDGRPGKDYTARVEQATPSPLRRPRPDRSEDKEGLPHLYECIGCHRKTSSGGSVPKV